MFKDNPFHKHLHDKSLPKIGSASNLVGRKLDWVILDEASQQSKFAPVAPYHILQQFVVNDYIPRNLLMLAHDVVEHEEEYRELFEHSCWNDTNIIMDNSVIELNKPVDLKMMIHAMDIVCADIAVLPDTVGDRKNTVEQVFEAYEEWSWKLRDYKLMALIQGADVREWLTCLETLTDACPTPWIGIPRVTEGIKDDFGRVYGRKQLVNYVKTVAPKAQIHLFGFSNQIWSDLEAAAHPDVTSIDSNVPLRLLTNTPLSEDPGPRGDWWKKARYNPLMIDNCRQVDHYISRF